MPRPGTTALIVFLMFAIAFRKTDSTPATASASSEIFTDITEQAGITWQQFGGESPDRFLIETMGGGVGFLDFDNDGLLDIFFLNGGETPHGKSPIPLRNALYRNLGDGRFENVAAKAGLDKLNFYGMGVAAADFDNDGYQDLYTTGYPLSALYHNNRDGTFTDVTDKAGLKSVRKWAAGAAWFDYDRDGFLDLIVTNYAQFSFEDPKKCELNHLPAYCVQTAYTGLPLTLYHNNGDGTFSDVSRRSGFDKLIGRGLGVVAVDVNDDGWPDLFIARDASPNLLLINKHDGTFEDIALEAEVAYDQNGIAKAGMGVDAGDVNGDGIPDFVVTNFNDQYHSLFLGSKSLAFSDRTNASHLANLTRSFVGWGAKFLDYDNDGNLDVMLINGHINQEIESTRVDVKYKEPALLLRNNGSGVFDDMRELAGATFQRSYLGRSLAIGDFDNDGDADAVFTTLNGRPVLLRNNAGQDNSWVGFSLQGTVSNRDAIGAKITVTSSGRTLTRWIVGGGSYLGSQDKRVLVGLGSSARPVDADIRWPNGIVQHLSDLQPRHYHQIVEPAASSSSKKSQN
ncbi:MAG TPA: CRTAC1 family protein [Terriglobales bacterium]|nr:CRTAC1 family protein [Terriglobales bacterium]